MITTSSPAISSRRWPAVRVPVRKDSVPLVSKIKVSALSVVGSFSVTVPRLTL